MQKQIIQSASLTERLLLLLLYETQFMLVRKLKCNICGASKVNKATTGYLYCDYCASFMGYDFEATAEEAVQVFDSAYYAEHGKWPDDVQAYMDNLAVLGKAQAENDMATYKTCMVKHMDIDTTLFPKRYTPRMKIPAYKKKYMQFYDAMMDENIRNGYYLRLREVQEKLMEMQKEITMETVNYRTTMVYDEKLEQYFDYIREFFKSTAEAAMQSESVKLHPEENLDSNYADMIYKQSINAYTKSLSPEAFEKVIQHLGLKTEYIEIGDVEMENKNCCNCGASLSVPKGSEFLVCEYCGNTNSSKKNEIKCIDCGTPFSVKPDDKTNACPSCGAIFKPLIFNEPTSSATQTN